MYLLDANVLIEAKNKHYAFDIVPAFWDWIATAHGNGRVFTIQKVADEIMAGGDALSQWLANQPASFRLHQGPQDTTNMAALAQWASGNQFSQAAVSTFLQAADYYLVAQAASLGYTVVTHETPAPNAVNRVKIPDACLALGVAWTTRIRCCGLKASGSSSSTDGHMSLANM